MASKRFFIKKEVHKSIKKLLLLLFHFCIVYKDSMYHKITTLLFFSISLLFLQVSFVFAQQNTEDIPSLNFQTLSSNKTLSTAVDSESNVWVKGLISDSLLHSPVIFQIPSIHISDYELYAYQDGKLQNIKKNVDRNGKEFKSRYPLFFIQTSSPEYYLNIKKQAIKTLDIQIKEFGEYAKHAWLNIIHISIYYGLAIMSIIFNLVFYYIFRDPRFTLYALLQIGIFSTFAYEDGMFYYISGNKWILPYFLIWVSSTCSVLAAFFTYYFLNLKENMPYFFKLAIPVIISLLIFSILYTLTDHPVLYAVNTILWFILPAICFYQAIKMFKTDPYARFLIINFGVLVLVGMGYTLHNNYDAELFRFFGINTLRLASALELIAVSFALIFKVRALREENTRYKIELRHYLDLLNLSRSLEIEKTNTQIETPIEADYTTDKNNEQILIEQLKAEYQLTDREAEVLTYLWEGNSNKEISEKLFISVNTTKFHISRLYGKLDINNRIQARALKEDKVVGV